jgi:hypothetical protein
MFFGDSGPEEGSEELSEEEGGNQETSVKANVRYIGEKSVSKKKYTEMRREKLTNSPRDVK